MVVYRDRESILFGVIGMNRLQRTNYKIKRDIAVKSIKLFARNNLYCIYENTISWHNFLEALKKCCKGVNWKNSVQIYYENAIMKIANARNCLVIGKTPHLHSVGQIVIHERGKERIIIPIKMEDRIIQRVFCDYTLVPLFKDYLIYDNGASTKNKGVDFARKRLLQKIRTANKRWNCDYYVLQFDFKKYFDSIPHKTCYKVLKSKILDNNTVNIIMDTILSYKRNEIRKIGNKSEREEQLRKLEKYELCGICLGSQFSQILALIVPNKLDHFIKDQCKVKEYIRYMDDGILFAESKDELWRLYKDIKAVCLELGLNFNDKKTRIVHISKGFTFMKLKYQVINGKTIIRLTRKGITRQRRKLKKLRKLVDAGFVTLDDVYQSMQSWLAHAYKAMSYTTRKNMLNLYDDLFDGYRITKKFSNLVKKKIRGRNVPDEILQDDKWYKYRWDCDAA